MYDLVIRNGKLVSQDRIFEATICIKNGKFDAFLSPFSEVEGREIIDAAGNLLFPGIIDCHAHMNEPGFEYREDFCTGSRAAAAAGCTTLIDMPLNNNPSLMNKEIFDMKLNLVEKHSYVDFALWGGIVGNYDEKEGTVKNNIEDLPGLKDCGVAAFKAFTCPNGDLFPAVNLGIIKKALEKLKKYNAIAGFHCEEFGLVYEYEKENKKNSENRNREEKIRDFLDSHDFLTEYIAVRNVLDLAKATGGRIHICHVSHPEVAEEIKKAMFEGVKVTAETCPHYLICDEDFLFEKGVPAKCTPPFRKKNERIKLWDYVLDGTLSCVGSDHSPAADDEKDNETKDIWTAWGGLNSIQYFLPMMFDFIVHEKKESPIWISRVMGKNPAELFGLYGRKGAFEIGFDADVVIVDPLREWEISQENLFTRGHITCFDGMKGKGFPIRTILRGKTIAENGQYSDESCGYGEFLEVK